ncbi:putative pentatricopeptide repeat-containing protein [Acorus gramineus]|uniref:Pentatricopeptide repeat-containing protein n=1 Tax=Acorus gramineus TaxID=55184 RepID=A0AAV9ATB0_ACOGR|nr:putative pentatricopeptide repeat-containing protein [Acorus gramineus]
MESVVGIHHNEFTFATVLTACVAPFGFDHGRQIHTQVVKNGFNTHKFVGSSLLDMYAKAGRIHEARKIFNSLPEQDVVSCTAIIAGYAQLGLDKEALEMFQKLFNQGLKSNSVTYASILTAISGLANLDYGRQVHCLVIRCELPYYVALQNSLIDMYSKCGALTYSRRVFNNMLQKNVISWNAMLVGYGKHGCGEDVIELFKTMLKSEISPNRVTYMAVLSGCSHGGLVKEGLDVFEMLIRDREVQPDIEHYGCVVDLLGRAGQVEKAFEFVKQMPFKPTAAVWGSLLNACRVHSNVPIGEFVARKLFEIEPENAGNYVNVSNIYANSKKWEDMCYVRELMKEKAVVKEPGQSWMKIDLLE